MLATKLFVLNNFFFVEYKRKWIALELLRDVRVLPENQKNYKNCENRVLQIVLISNCRNVLRTFLKKLRTIFQAIAALLWKIWASNRVGLFLP
jgi:hypothetical protein